MLEVLQLTNEDLIGAFGEIIEDKFDVICMKYGVVDEILESEK
jgi:hypothetical protein